MKGRDEYIELTNKAETQRTHSYYSTVMYSRQVLLQINYSVGTTGFPSPGRLRTPTFT